MLTNIGGTIFELNFVMTFFSWNLPFMNIVLHLKKRTNLFILGVLVSDNKGTRFACAPSKPFPVITIDKVFILFCDLPSEPSVSWLYSAILDGTPCVSLFSNISAFKIQSRPPFRYQVAMNGNPSSSHQHGFNSVQTL